MSHEYPKYVFHADAAVAPKLVQDEVEEALALQEGFIDPPSETPAGGGAGAGAKAAEEFPKYLFRGTETRLVSAPEDDAAAKAVGFTEHPNDFAPHPPPAPPAHLDAPGEPVRDTPLKDGEFGGVAPIAPFVAPSDVEPEPVALTPQQKRAATMVAKKAKAGK